MAVQCAFHSFMIQTAENSVAARKILEGKGVAHYRDLCASHVDRKNEVVCGARGAGRRATGRCDFGWAMETIGLVGVVMI